MPLPDGLLNPIPGENPSGQNLRYDPVYDKIREARRVEDDIQMSDESAKKDVWARAVKKADFAQAIKLCTESLLQRSKDIQIAVWLTDALLAQEQVPGLTQGLDLTRELIETFWDTLYPEIEDGDLGMRAGPIEWLATRLAGPIHKVALTKNKLDWFKYQESRRVGYEADAAGNESAMTARAAAIAGKKCTAEEFDEAVRSTSNAFYEQLNADLEKAMAAAGSLEMVCEARFGEDSPSFADLKSSIDDLQLTLKQIWQPVAEAAESAAEEAIAETAPTNPMPLATTAKRVVDEEPADYEDAVRRVVSASHYLRRQNCANPTPYLMLRGLRWGELRDKGSTLDGSLLESPPTETREQLKRLASESQWSELLESAESAMALPCGRGWLDLQRHVVRACENLGFQAVALAVRATLRTMLSDYPELLSVTLSDDTATANKETQDWIKESVMPPAVPPPPEPGIQETPEAACEPEVTTDPGENAVHEMVLQAARNGRIQEAVQLLSREISQAPSGRSRFQRKIQLAALCLSSKHQEIAYPILAELADEMERRRLEEWEEASDLAHPLVLLLTCMERMGRDDAEKKRIHARICRLDPVLALSSSR